MAAKFFLVACATALFVSACKPWTKLASRPHESACPCGSANIGNVGLIGSGLAGYGSGCGYGLGASNIVSPSAAVSSGGALGVTTSSSYAPSGVQLVSNNEIQGLLQAAGSAPFIAAVAFDGTVDSAGQAPGAYSCGGNDGIAADSLAAAGLSSGAYNGLGASNLGLGASNLGLGVANLGVAGLSGARIGLGSLGCGCY